MRWEHSAAAAAANGAAARAGARHVAPPLPPPPPPPPPLSPRGAYAQWPAAARTRAGAPIYPGNLVGLCDGQPGAKLECESLGLRLATLYSAEDQAAAVPRAAAGQGSASSNHWTGGYVRDLDSDHATVADMHFYWEERDADGNALEAIIVEGDDWLAHTQAYTNWYLQRNDVAASPFSEVQANTNHPVNDFVQLRGNQGRWRYRASNQAAYALCPSRRVGTRKGGERRGSHRNCRACVGHCRFKNPTL